jgi:branched-subunit amino acid ABC-type transport system permease component
MSTSKGMQIPIQGQYAEQDVRRAISLGYGRGFRVARIIFVAIAAVVVLATLVLAVSGTEGALTPLIYSLPGLLVLAFLPWALQLILARQVANSPLCKETVTGVATDEFLQIRNNLSESRVRWDAFVSYKMSDDVILLYQHNAAFCLVPRRLLASDKDWGSLRQHVRANVPEKPQRSSVGRWLAIGLIVLWLTLLLIGLLQSLLRR